VIWLQAGNYTTPSNYPNCPNTTGNANEHPATNRSVLVCVGEAWTTAQIYAVMSNPNLWKNTAIFVMWDDYGGFADHQAPTVDAQDWRNGFRVPALCISRFCKKGYSTTPFVFESAVALIENAFLGGTRLPGGLYDSSANDLGLGCVAGPGCTGHLNNGMLDMTLNNPTVLPSGVATQGVKLTRGGVIR
jgi:phospholipase C